MCDQRLARLLALGLLLLSGCRFGNYADAPKPNFKETYKSVELYFTQANKLSTTVVLDDDSVNENANVPLSAIPESVQNTFTNPVYYAVPIDPTQYPMFIGLDQSSYVTTSVNPDGTIKDEYPAKPVVLWKNPNCATQIQIDQQGKLDTTRTGTVTYSDGSVAPVSGHLNLTFSFLRIISGDCADDLQYLANCYTNGVGCSTSDLQSAKGLFDLYVRQSGVLDISKAIHVRGLAYTVQFE